MDTSGAAPLKLDGYIRVSKVRGREGDSFISPTVQREKIQAWADYRGVEIVRWYEDLDQSGGKLSRPGLDAIMDRIRAGRTGGIAVAKLDRLSRAGVGEALKLVEEIGEHGAKLAALDVDVDPTTEQGELMLTLMLAMARMERRRIAANWRDARARALARGVFRAKAPYGYTKDTSGRLQPDDCAEWVRTMYALRLSGKSHQQIADHLNGEGVAPPASKQWARQTVKDVLANRVYLGIASDGDLPENPTAHEALVNAATFDACKGSAVHVPAKSQGNLLAGLVRCAGCSYCLHGGTAGSKGKRHRNYACGKRHGAGDCPKPAGIRSDGLEEWVVTEFLNRIESPTLAPRQVVACYTEAKDRVAEVQRRRKSLATDTEAQYEMGRENWLAALKAMRDAEALAVRELEDARSAATGVDLAGHTNLREEWPNLDVPTQRRLLALAIDAVMVRATGRGKGNYLPPEHPNRTRILWKGEAPELPVPGARGHKLREFVFAPDSLPVESGAVPQDANEGVVHSLGNLAPADAL